MGNWDIMIDYNENDYYKPEWEESLHLMVIRMYNQIMLI